MKLQITIEAEDQAEVSRPRAVSYDTVVEQLDSLLGAAETVVGEWKAWKTGERGLARLNDAIHALHEETILAEGLLCMVEEDD